MTAMTSRKPRRRLNIKTAGATVAAAAILLWSVGVWSMLSFARDNGTPNSSSSGARPSTLDDAATSIGSVDGGASSTDGEAAAASSSSNVAVLDGKRILYAVASYNQTQIPYPMIAALRDACEHGARIDVVVYSTRPWSVDYIDDVNAMTRRCRHPSGTVTVTVRLKSDEWGDSLVDFHRALFYDKLDSYDLFVYTEDDQLVRSTTMAAFLDETAKVRRLVGNERFADYAVGFLRFEVDGAVSPHVRKKLIFEHKWPTADDFGEQLLIRHDGLDGLYFTTPGMHHQGMFMATPEQLRAWRTRGPECHFDTVEQSSSYFHKIRASSVHLFRTDGHFGCNVTQLLPIDAFDDLLVHHLSNKYCGTKKYEKLVMPTSRLRALLLKARNDLLISKNSDNGGEKKKKYSGVDMFKDDEEKPLDAANLDEYVSYVKAHGTMNPGTPRSHLKTGK